MHHGTSYMGDWFVSLLLWCCVSLLLCNIQIKWSWNLLPSMMLQGKLWTFCKRPTSSAGEEMRGMVTGTVSLDLPSLLLKLNINSFSMLCGISVIEHILDFIFKYQATNTITLSFFLSFFLSHICIFWWVFLFVALVVIGMCVQEYVWVCVCVCVCVCVFVCACVCSVWCL